LLCLFKKGVEKQGLPLWADDFGSYDGSGISATTEQPKAMRKKLGLYIVFFLILFLGFYFALRRFVPGFFGEVKALSYLHSFSFTDQDGRQITDKDVAGKVFVAEYFFTTCHGICPEMNVNIRKLSREFAGEPDFRILSHTVDPETDSVARMKKYADSLGVDPARWFLLTGRKDSLYRMARESYLLDDPKNNLENINEQFIHTQFVALVDKSGRIRKIYDSLKKDEILELEKDIKSMLKEDAGTPRFAHSLFSNDPG
jgi:protein SCO1